MCVQHSLSCGELDVRTEAMTALCSQLLPHLCADDACLASQDPFPTKVCVYAAAATLPWLNSECLARQIERVIKSTGRSICDLLSQQKLEDAAAELEVRLFAMIIIAVHNLKVSPSVSAPLCQCIAPLCSVQSRRECYSWLPVVLSPRSLSPFDVLSRHREGWCVAVSLIAACLTL